MVSLLRVSRLDVVVLSLWAFPVLLIATRSPSTREMRGRSGVAKFKGAAAQYTRGRRRMHTQHESRASAERSTLLGGPTAPSLRAPAVNVWVSPSLPSAY